MDFFKITAPYLLLLVFVYILIDSGLYKKLFVKKRKRNLINVPSDVSANSDVFSNKVKTSLNPPLTTAEYVSLIFMPAIMGLLSVCGNEGVPHTNEEYKAKANDKATIDAFISLKEEGAKNLQDERI